jgi:MFS family permease
MKLNNSGVVENSNGNGIKSNSDDSSNLKEVEKIDWIYWMKKVDFYAYMIVYMCVRLSINVTSSMIPYYLDRVLLYHQGTTGRTAIEISLVLIISMSGSVFNSLILQTYFLKSKDRLVRIMWSGFFVLAGCLPILILTVDYRWMIFVLSFIFGIGFSLGLSTASSLINDVVGSKAKKGAFVYGAYSFTDKMSCGVVLYFFTTCVIDNDEALKITTSLLPPISMFFAFLMVLLRKNAIEKEVKKEKEMEKENLIEDPFMKKEKSIIDDSRFTFVTLK